MDFIRLTPRLSPQGHLTLAPDDEGPELEAEVADRLAAAFERGPGHGLFRLGAVEAGRALPPAFAYWREFSGGFVAAVCARPDSDGARSSLSPPSEIELQALSFAAPAMPGAEYLTAEVLRSLWAEMDAAFAAELSESGAPVADFLRGLNPAWNVVGRVHFNLAENRRDDLAPFAFLATYTGRLSVHGRAQHQPLGQARLEYTAAADKDRLLSLLLPVQRAAERLDWLKRMVDAGEIFHPLRWSAGDAFRMLSDAAELERAGVVVRLPAAWKLGRPSRPQVTATVGGREPSRLGQDALLDFNLAVTLDGEPLSPEEVRALLDSVGGLALIRGQWVEVDQARLTRTLERMQQVERLAAETGLPFAEAMRMLSGADFAAGDEEENAGPQWSSVVAGPWLGETLKGLRSPEGLAATDPGPGLRGELRPYQQVGVRWLHLLSRLGLGACLADDMGLGKTIQVLALLLARRGQGLGGPSLLVAPASLLANWAAEIDRFAPGLKAVIAHTSALPAVELKAGPPAELAATDLVITSYGSLVRIPWLAATAWRLLILDEAQAIKNPETKQTRAAKKIRASARIVLTGTPIENRLSDLWSIFDFLNPGLLGTAKQFTRYTKSLAEKPNPYGPLRDLCRPYILRRLKTDRRVISDLPDKTELKAYCSLSRRQAALYQQAVKELAALLESADGIQRKGLVLAFLMRFKQICNHPSQWLGDGAWGPADSGKFARLGELCETVAAKQEKALVFTQFRETTAPLAAFLGGVFGRPGLVLHGETPVKKRAELVRRFQEDEQVPFFVLSLKAGGSGLNLTAAAHVIHFDRWWNPAVENQATDRAFRIGQTKNVLVHKFVCRGTVEEKIDALIESKKQLSQELLAGGAEINLTEMRDEELLKLVALDLGAAIKE